MSTPLDWSSGDVILDVEVGRVSTVDVPTPSVEVLVIRGKDGAGVNLRGAVPTYVDLPDDLGPDDNGVAYMVQANGKLYVWSGTGWPAEANGADFRGEKGDTGVGVAAIALSGDGHALVFDMTEGPDVTVPVPAVQAALDAAAAATSSAGAAHADRLAAEAARSGAEDARDDADTQHDAAVVARAGAEAARDVADGYAADAQASAADADGYRGDAAAAATTAQGHSAAASGAAVTAAGHATAAEGYRDDAAASALSASNSASDAEDSAAAAATSETNAGVHAQDAHDWADAAAQSAQEAADTVLSGVPNATTTAKGGIILAGDLAGTWDAPTVPGLGAKADLVDGKIPVSQIPAQATNERYVVANTAARLALTTAQVQPGDMAIQTGNPGRGTYILNGPDPSVEGNWVLMVNPDAPVSSVNGYSGIVVLGKTDVGLGNVDNTADSAKPVSAAQQAALDGKANTAHAHAASDITSGTLDVARLPVGTSGTQVAAGNDSRITGAVQTSRTISTTGGLSGGGNLSTNRTITIEDGGIVKAKLASGVQSSLDKADTALQSVVIPADMSVIAFGKDTVRAAGLGDNPFGVKVRRAVRIKTVHYRALTADASGNLVVELRKNGSVISGSSVTVAAASQVAGSASSTIDVDLAAGDILTVQVTGVGTTPGKGLVADVEAVVI